MRNRKGRAQSANDYLPWHDAIAQVGRKRFQEVGTGVENSSLYATFHFEACRRYLNAAYPEARVIVLTVSGDKGADAFKARQFGQALSEAAKESEMCQLLGVSRDAAIRENVKTKLKAEGLDYEAAERWNSARGWLVNHAGTGDIAIGIRRGSLPAPTPLPFDSGIVMRLRAHR